MAYCHPAAQFCCGCSLSFGVKTILVLHMIQNLFYMFVPVATIVLKYTHTAASLTQQTVVAGFGLAGVPIIIAAFWGLRNRVEVPIRLYGFYMVLCLILDLIFILDEFYLSSPCALRPMMAKKRERRLSVRCRAHL